jgi:hypothetical protein
MTEPGPSAGFAVQDISVDRDGRVSITNPWIAGRLHSAAAIKRPAREEPENGNCSGCNTVKGCGPTNNTTCPVNTTPHCGVTKIDEDRAEG